MTMSNCVYNNDTSTYFATLNIVEVVSFIGVFVTSYIIIFHSTKAMSDYRWFLVNTTFWCYMSEMQYSVGMRMVIDCGHETSVAILFTGAYSKININTAIQLVMTLHVLIISVCTINTLFIYRLSTAVDRFAYKGYFKLAHIVNYAFVALPGLATYYPGYVILNEQKAFYLKNPPCIGFDVSRYDNSYSLLADTRSLIVLLGYVYFVLIAVSSIACAGFCFYFSLYFIKSRSINMSPTVNAMQKSLTWALLSQTSIHIAVYGIPASIIAMTGFWNSSICSPGIANIGLIFQTMHSVIMNCATVGVHKPYRRYGSWSIPNDICQFQTDSSLTPLQKIKAVNDNYNTRSGETSCSGVDHAAYIQYMQETDYGSVAASRAWIYQTCTEFGYYQSTDSPTAGPFFGGVGTVTADYYTQECSDIFGPQLNSDTVAAAVAQTNQYYGGRDGFYADYVIIPNGNIDPWSALSILNTNAPNVVPIMIDGGSHCSDMYGSSSSDSASLTAARAQIQQQLAQWLNG